MTNAFTSAFEASTGAGDYIDTEPDDAGRFFRATIHDDLDCDPPWENSDGHGPVSDWRSIDDKRPGERVLCADGGRALFYDVEEATRIAKRYGWDAPPCGVGTPAERAARAVAADYALLKSWCDGEWRYVGIIVSLHQIHDAAGDSTLDHHLASLWALESGSETSPEYLNDVAHELLAEAQESAQNTGRMQCTSAERNLPDGRCASDHEQFSFGEGQV